MSAPRDRLRELVARARLADEPSRAELDRAWGDIARDVRRGVAPPFDLSAAVVAPPAAVTAAGGLAAKALVAVVATASAGGIAWWAVDRPSPPATPVVAAPARSAERDSLSAELALLARARQAFAAQDPQAARAALAEHGRRFPAGALAEDREALRALVLCEGQRTRSEGHKVAARFLEDHPRSLHADRVAAACLGGQRAR